MRVDVASGLQHLGLGLVGGHSTMFDQPAGHDGRTAGPTGFAMHVNPFALLDRAFHEIDRAFDGLQSWVGEVGGRNPQLLYSVLFILGDWPLVFLAGVDDRTDADLGQLFDIPGKGIRSQDDVLIDRIPPVSDLENPTQQYVPQEGGVEYQIRIQLIPAVAHQLRFQAQEGRFGRWKNGVVGCASDGRLALSDVIVHYDRHTCLHLADEFSNGTG